MSKNNLVLILVSFAIIYIVWGSTYLFAAFALKQLPAFGTCGIRYLVASVITFVIYLMFYKFEIPDKKALINSVIAGFVFLGLGTGGAIWSLNFLDTGFTALIIAGEPLIIVLMMWLFLKKPPAGRTLLGIFLGIAGMYLLVSQKTLVSTTDQWIGVLVIFLSMLAWGSGSIFVSKAKLPENQFLNTTIQMFIGGLTTLVISFIIGERIISFSEWADLTVISISFLVIFGSVAAFTAFNYLLKNVSPEKVVTNTYVNPIIAMILGLLFNNEIIPAQSMVAALVMLFGVFLINSNKGKKV